MPTPQGTSNLSYELLLNVQHKCVNGNWILCEVNRLSDLVNDSIKLVYNICDVHACMCIYVVDTLNLSWQQSLT